MSWRETNSSPILSKSKYVVSPSVEQIVFGSKTDEVDLPTQLDVEKIFIDILRDNYVDTVYLFVYWIYQYLYIYYNILQKEKENY